MDFSSILAQAPLFSGLGDAALRDLASRAERQVLRSGERLFAEGESADFFYLVVSGRLRVASQEAVVGYVGRLEPVGEMGIVTGEPRTAAVHAVRDSIVLRIARADLLEFLDGHAATLMSLARLMIGRLRQQGRQRMLAATEVQGTFAIIPASPEVPVMALAEAIVRGLSGWPTARLISAAHVDAALGAGAARAPLSDDDAGTRLLTWLNELESRHRYVIYAADSDRDAWAVRCLHHADRVLVLAEASTPATAVPVLGELRDGEPTSPGGAGAATTRRRPLAAHARVAGGDRRSCALLRPPVGRR